MQIQLNERFSILTKVALNKWFLVNSPLIPLPLQLIRRGRGIIVNEYINQSTPRNGLKDECTNAANRNMNIETDKVGNVAWDHLMMCITFPIPDGRNQEGGGKYKMKWNIKKNKQGREKNEKGGRRKKKVERRVHWTLELGWSADRHGTWIGLIFFHTHVNGKLKPTLVRAQQRGIGRRHFKSIGPEIHRLPSALDWLAFFWVFVFLALFAGTIW